jgi:hypothetical protein
LASATFATSFEGEQAATVLSSVSAPTTAATRGRIRDDDIDFVP